MLWKSLNTNHVPETKPKDLAVGAIKSVVSALNPFSQYLENKAYKEMKNETEWPYKRRGVGLYITVKNGFLTVVSPIPDTPTYRAGIVHGDKIVKINNRSAITMSSGEAIGLMNDKTGKKLKSQFQAVAKYYRLFKCEKWHYARYRD
ncbi:MAG: PDZ domain-containing protein [Endomicrobium sp.]|nr:PDZ domain-containing protein [Endomicrobium sp.]